MDNNKCKNCKHWILPKESEYFGVECLATPGNPLDEWRAIKDEELQRNFFGHATKYCRSPKLKFHQRPEKAEACVADGSQYLAVLITGEDFGCINWEGKQPQTDNEKIECSQNPCPECGSQLILKWSGVKCSKCDYWNCL